MSIETTRVTLIEKINIRLNDRNKRNDYHEVVSMIKFLVSENIIDEPVLIRNSWMSNSVKKILTENGYGIQMEDGYFCITPKS